LNGIAQDAAQVGQRLPQRDVAEQIRDVQHADDVVEVLAVHGEPRVAALAECLGDVGERCVDGQRHHLGAGHHDLARGEIGEAEDAVEHLLLFLFEDAGFLARGDQHLELFFRVHQRVAARRLEADARTTRRPSVFSAVMNGHNTRMKISVGRVTSSAVDSGCCSATVFGASSPSTMCSAVMIENEMTTAIVCAVIVETYDPSARNGGSMKAASAGSPTQPRPRLAMVMPSWVAAM
jgi:hypothetical protein